MLQRQKNLLEPDQAFATDFKQTGDEILNMFFIKLFMYN